MPGALQQQPLGLEQPTQVKVEMPAKLQQAGRSARQSMLEDSLDLEDFEDPIMGAGGKFVLFCKLPVDCQSDPSHVDPCCASLQAQKPLPLPPPVTGDQFCPVLALF